jgi:hypothetical protein
MGITALAIAAPIAVPVSEASAATPVAVFEPSVGQVAYAQGPTVIGSVFNGGTTVVVSTSPAFGTVVGSP